MQNHGLAFCVQIRGLRPCFCQGGFQFLYLEHRRGDAVIGFGSSLIETAYHFSEELLADSLRRPEFGYTVSLNEGDIVFESLIAGERVMVPTPLSAFCPTFACLVFFALPTKLDSFLFHRTRDKRTARTHSEPAFAAVTPACALGVIARAKSAR